MARIALTDGSGRWFDSKSAVKFDEDTRWNGNNHISRATGSQWDHEALYYTASGNWVLNHWSQWQGSLETYEAISEDDAVQWLICQEAWDQLNDLPDAVQKLVEAGVEAAEL